MTAISSTWDKLDCPTRSPSVFRSRQMSPALNAAFRSFLLGSFYISFLRYWITAMVRALFLGHHTVDAYAIYALNNARSDMRLLVGQVFSKLMHKFNP